MAAIFGCSENLSPRLIDYVVFVGKKNPSRNGVALSQPELLRVYPPESHTDFALPNDIVYFCQPEGCYNTSSNSFVLDPRHSGSFSPANIKMEFFTFILTDKESNTVRFGVCLNFLRPIVRRKVKCASETKQRRFSSNKSMPPKINTRKKRLQSCGGMSDSSLSSDSSYDVETYNADRLLRPYTHTLTSLCLVSSYQFCKKFEQCVKFLYILIQKLHEACKPRYAGRQTVWSVLTGAIDSADIPSVRKSIEEIDTWILRLLSIPAPVAGRTVVHAYLQPETLANPIIFALPEKKRFPLVDYALHLPLELLGVEKFLKVFFSLLLEQKIIMESSHHDRLTTCVLALTALCYPLQYLFTVIPLLPTSLKGAEQLLQAPSPYIIGLPRSFRDIRLSFQLPKDVLLVDLDTQELYGQGAQDPLPKFPPAEEKQLVANLTKTLNGLRRRRDEGTETSDFKRSEKKQSNEPLFVDLDSLDPLSPDLDKDSLHVLMRVAMARFFKSPNVLGGFAEYTRTVRIYPRPVVAFQFEQFMKSRMDPSPFTVVLAKTQAVEYFAEWLLMPNNVAFRKIDDGMVNLSEIGDKDRWFSEDLATVRFQLWTERFDRGLLRQVVEILFAAAAQQTVSPPTKDMAVKPAYKVSASMTVENDKLSDDADTPTDFSASNGDSKSISDVETLSEDELGAQMSCDISDIVTILLKEVESSGGLLSSSQPNNGLFVSLALSSTENMGCLKFGSPLPSNLRVYYSPPTNMVIPEAPPACSEANSTISPYNTLSRGFTVREAIHRLEIDTTVPHISPTPLASDWQRLADREFCTSDSPGRARSISSWSRLRSPLHPTKDLVDSGSPYSANPSKPPPSRSRESKSAFGSWFTDAERTDGDSSNAAERLERLEKEMLENQHFIRHCASLIRKGSQPGMFSRRRLQRLMEEEAFRKFALDLVIDNVDPCLPTGGQIHVSDVVLGSWDQYKAYVWLFVQIGIGVRQSFRPMSSSFIDSRGEIISPVGLAQSFRELFSSQSEKKRLTRGGLFSAFNLLRMAHTHCYLLPKRKSQIRSANPNAHPTVAVSVPNSPYPQNAGFGDAVVPRGDVAIMNGPSSASSTVIENTPLSEPISASSTTFNVINTQNHVISPLISAPWQLSLLTKRPQITKEDYTRTPYGEISMDMVQDMVLLSPFKSVASHGYRYRHGRLFQMAANVSSSVTAVPPPCISVSTLRQSLADQKANEGPSLAATRNTDRNLEEGHREVRPEELRSKIGLTYLFEEAMIQARQSRLWTNMQFWEDFFLDMVAHERSILCMDFDPPGLLQHFSQLDTVGRKRLELTEDALLAVVMHNLIAFMVMAQLPPDIIRLKVRRLLAKSHTGLHYTQRVTQLLDCLEWLRGNDIDLLPMASQQLQLQSYPVLHVWEDDSELFNLEIYEDFLVLRSLDGCAFCRWWFDQIINITHSPQAHIICFQVRLNSRRERFVITAEDIQTVFSSIASALSRARSKSQQGQIIEKLGGRVNVINAETGEEGEIDIGPNGFRLTFGHESNFFPLCHVKRCLVADEDTFRFVVADHDGVDVVWSFKTDLATILLNQWERLLVVALITHTPTSMSRAMTPALSRSRAYSKSSQGAHSG